MFALRLKELREQKGLSQYGLAAVLQCPQSTVGGWEAGKRETNFANLIRLADYFNVSVDYLLGREEKAPSEQEKAQGVVDMAQISLTVDEDEVITYYRELGQKRGSGAQQAFKTVLVNMVK